MRAIIWVDVTPSDTVTGTSSSFFTPELWNINVSGFQTLRMTGPVASDAS
jgi:hypothetical protein